MTSAVRTDYRQNLVAYAEKLGMFFVRLSPRSCLTMDENERCRIVQEVIRPLVEVSQVCYLYHPNATSPPVPGLLKEERGRFRIDVSRAFEPPMEEYWAAFNGVRGTILWVCRRSRVLLDCLYDRSFDPDVFGNPGATMSKSAIAFARRRVASRPDDVAFGLSVTNGVEWVMLFVTRNAIREELNRALDRCTLSQRYLALYGDRNWQDLKGRDPI